MVGDWRSKKFARKFPRSIIEADPADRQKTQELPDDLIARGNAVGIVNNVGLECGLRASDGSSTSLA